ncbi:PaaI family thioesterase [Acidovorax sp.]|uniref:PaaI family thioesterase n=1 Tax=Acidovorax sp. TaxID=1872122 RepID=UPI002ACED065|nr:PaaI family thioesterase [Acidovorax sp.]MDZ7861867.1 PaaI family thioesterase [Acidovorax sp.]
MTSPAFEVRTPHYADRVRDSFALQGAMQTLGARLARIEPGAVDIELDWAAALTQQHGFLHAGMVATALDSACGYAGFTLMGDDAAVLTIEFKINLLAPAQGERFRMEGRVLKPGRTITVTEGRAYALGAQGDKLVATMGCTLMAVTGREMK